MVRRAIAATLMAIVLGCGLAGCQQAGPGSFTRTVAQADVAAWTKGAVEAAHPSNSATKLSAFETCRSNTAYFATTFQWRTITNVDVSASDQPAATRAIEAAFERANWKLSLPGGLVTLTGPDDQKRRGLITIQTAGPTQLAISVVSPCYT
jgi:hypothetical protein